MTRQAHSPGHKPRTTGGGRIDRPAPVDPTAETRADALAYLQRTGNADVAEALGLVDDPIIVARTRARALAAPLCPTCQNKLPGRGVCRRSQQCREAARERGEPA